MSEQAADNIRVLHRDEHIVVLDKPSGLSLLRDRDGTPCLWDSLADGIGAKPYLVHRLDKPTSGVLLVALDQPTQRTLTRAFQQRLVRKYYLAWTTRAPGKSGLIDLPLRRGRKNRYRIDGARADIRSSHGDWQLEPVSAGKSAAHAFPAVTRYRTLRQTGDRALLLLNPKTGRTHQLRVHLAWIGAPILGDRLYGRPEDPIQRAERLQLHAHRLVVPGIGAFAAPTPHAADGACWLD